MLVDSGIEQVGIELGGSGLAAECVNPLDDVEVFGVPAAGGETAEGGFLAALFVDQAYLFDGVIHASEILHHVAEAHIVVLQLQAYGVVGIHLLFQEIQMGIAGQDDGQVLRFGAELHFGSRQVATCAAGKAHHHRVVSLFEATQTDGQVLLDVQGDVALAVFSRLSVLVSIDAEEGEVGVLTGPDPVVRIAAELSDIQGRVDNQSHVGIGLLVEQEKLVGTKERLDACLDAFLLAQVAFAEHFLGEGLEEALTLGGPDVGAGLFGFGLHGFGHVDNAKDEGEAEVRRGQFLGAAFCKVAVLQVVVLHGAHGVYVAEAAVVVGQHESVGRDHFACAASAEDADTFAQRGCGFVVEAFGRQLQAGLSQGIGQVLALHQFQEPHTLVGVARKARQEYEGQCQDFLHK